MGGAQPREAGVEADEEAIGWHEAALRTQREMGAPRDETYSLLELAPLRVRNGDEQRGREELARAMEIADESGDERSQVLARCLGARLGVHDAADAAARLDAARLSALDRMDALFDLYLGTGERARLEQAGELMELLLEGAPAGDREGMRAYNALFRAVSGALKTDREQVR